MVFFSWFFIIMFIYGQSDTEYRSRLEIGSTTIKNFIQSPLSILEDSDQARKKVYDVGTMIHEKALDQKISIEIAPDIARRSKEDRQLWAEWFAKHGFPVNTGLPVSQWDAQHDIHFVQQAEMASIRGCVMSLWQSFPDVFALNKFEVSMFDGKNKGRADILDEFGCVIYDIKTIDSIGMIERNIQSYKMWVQVGHYCNIYESITGDIPGFEWLFVAKKPPYICQRVALSFANKIHAMAVCKHAYADYRDFTLAPHDPNKLNQIHLNRL